MTALRPRFRRVAWLALVAMLALALLPTVSRALARLAPASHGAALVAHHAGACAEVPGAGAPLSAAVHHSLDHCPYCALALAALGLPGQARHPVSPPGAAPAPMGRLQSRLSVRAGWQRQQPRAPPPQP
jgi:hypothetical protein